MFIDACYSYVQHKAKSVSEAEGDRMFNELHDRYSPIVEALTLKLKGARSPLAFML